VSLSLSFCNLEFTVHGAMREVLTTSDPVLQSGALKSGSLFTGDFSAEAGPPSPSPAQTSGNIR
jgi:hypothetical protein